MENNQVIPFSNFSFQIQNKPLPTEFLNSNFYGGEFDGRINYNDLYYLAQKRLELYGLIEIP